MSIRSNDAVRRRVRSALAALLLLAPIVAAQPAHALDPKLIDAAKKEGEVTWYTTLVVGQIVRPMIAAPHPNAARLFVEFNLSDEGQRIYAKAGYIPASPSVPAMEADLKPDAGHYTARIMAPGEFQVHEAEWSAIYKRLFQ